MSPETRDFLETVRGAEDPGPGDQSRVLAALQATIAAGPTNTGAEGASTTPGVLSGTGSGLKLLGALLGVSIGAAVLVSAVSSDPSERKVTLPSHQVPVANTLVSSPASAVSNTAPPPSASAASARATAPSAPPVSRAAAPVAQSGELARVTAPSSASLREEIALLAGVQSALERGDGADALRRLDGHVTSDRQFIAERRAARITALCQLGRVSEAQQHAMVFFRENAESVQRTAVERSCALPKSNPDR